MGRAVAFVDDRSGVSPVIGVILMVAVTVIIAAVIGSSTLGLSDSVSESPPQAQFEVKQEVRDITNNNYDTDDGTLEDAHLLTVEHTGGEDIDPANIEVQVNGDPAYGPVFDGTGADDTINADEYYGQGWGYGAVIEPFDNYEEVGAGDNFHILFAGGVIEEWQENTGNEIWDISMPHNSNNFLYDGNTFRTHDDYYADYQFEEGDTLQIVWESGDNSQVLAEYDVHSF